MPMSSKAARAKRAAERYIRPNRQPDFDLGYVRLPHAAIWQGSEAAPSLSTRPQFLTRFAKRSLMAANGEYVGVGRNAKGEVFVCFLADGTRRWKPWGEVEKVRGMQEWIRVCF